MSGRFAAWLRVTPRPTTLAESSAIFRHLKTKGRVAAFIKSPRRDNGGDSDQLTTLYYTLFNHEPPSLSPGSLFDVQVYHNVPTTRDEDPFNIRGLQNRKPWPSPVTFSCKVEKMDEDERISVEKSLKSNNLFHGHFKVKEREKDWLQEVMSETGTPAGIIRGLGQLAESIETNAELGSQQGPLVSRDNDTSSEKGKKDKGIKSSLRTHKRRLRMDSLIHMAESA